MKKMLVVITAAFFAAMLFLTVSAKGIHTAALPVVSVQRPEQKTFPVEYTSEDGTTATGTQTAVAVSEASLESGVYVIYTAKKNGTERTFVRKAEIATGEEKDGYFEVLSGLTYLDQIVTSDTADLYDGCEVRMEVDSAVLNE
jgi:hypothetical protein